MTIDEILRNKIVHIGETIPEDLAKDIRAKQVYLGYPQQLIDELKEAIILPKRFPKMGDREGELMCAGFNEYREKMLELFEPKPKIANPEDITYGKEPNNS